MRKLTETAQIIETLLEGELQPTAESLTVHMKKALAATGSIDEQAALCAEVAINFSKLIAENHSA